MTYYDCLLTRTRFGQARHSFAVRTAGLAVLLLVLFHSGAALAGGGGSQRTARQCSFSDAEFDPVTDVHALEAYQNAIAGLLKQENFSELRCLADAARTGKTRFPEEHGSCATFTSGSIPHTRPMPRRRTGRNTSNC